MTSDIENDEKIFFYKIFYNLPKLPEDIKNTLLSIAATNEGRKVGKYYVENNVADIFEGREYFKTGEEHLSLGNIELANEIENWCRENVFPKAHSWRVTKTEKKPRALVPVHTDRDRQFSLLYLLDTGGENPRTLFFKEPGQNILRDNNLSPQGNLDDLVFLKDINIPKETWTVFNSRILHSVVGIDRGRLSLQGYLDNTEDFLEDGTGYDFLRENQH